MKIVSSNQMKDLDQTMIHQYGISAMSLMETAGSGVADLVIDLINKNSWPRKVVLFAGRGNNGGDAFVAARLLEEKEIKTLTLVLASKDQIKGEAKEMLKRLKAHEAAILEVKSNADVSKAVADFGRPSIAVDGIVGTGSKGPLQGLFAEVAEMINAWNFLSVVAIDIPSGLNPDEGFPEGSCIRADHTVTLGLPKTGLVKREGLDWAGVLHVKDLGIPQELLGEIACREFMLTLEDLNLLCKRRPISHKGTYGHLLILGGSPGFTGAPCLAALAALRTGAGLVTVGIGESLNGILEIKLTEPMTLPLPEDKAGIIGNKALDRIINFTDRVSAVLIGPGLGTQDETVQLIHQLVQKIDVPIIIDADGLNALSKNIEVLKKAKAPVILTPHPGEMARLLGKTSEQVQKERWEFARSVAKNYKTITVLKGAGTVIALPDENILINVTGNAGMATGGMGDVLGGMIGGFIAQGMDSSEATQLGVYLHGACGDEASLSFGFEEGLLASDLLNFIPKKLKEFRTIKKGN